MSTHLSPKRLDTYIETILFGGHEEVEAFLAELDRDGDGAVSHMVSPYTGADRTALRAGRWFQAPNP